MFVQVDGLLARLPGGDPGNCAMRAKARAWARAFQGGVVVVVVAAVAPVEGPRG